MTVLQRVQLRRRKINALLGIVVTAGWNVYLGWSIGQAPPTAIWQWVIYGFAFVVLLLIFGSGTLVNAWAWGICQAVWEPGSENVHYELKRTNDYLAEQRAKLEAKLQ